MSVSERVLMKLLLDLALIVDLPQVVTIKYALKFVYINFSAFVKLHQFSLLSSPLCSFCYLMTCYFHQPRGAYDLKL